MKRDRIFGTHHVQTTKIGKFNQYIAVFFCVFALIFILNNIHRTAKQKLLGEISLEMDVTAEEVSSKFHALRTQFNREKGKEKQSKSGSGTSDVYTSKWEYFSCLKFLSVGTTPGETISVYILHFFSRTNENRPFSQNF